MTYAILFSYPALQNWGLYKIFGLNPKAKIHFFKKAVAETCYAAENKPKTGKGNLNSQADTLKQLGARSSKQLTPD